MAIIDRPQDYFNTVLYTGNGSTQSITGVGFQPDLIWVKSRSNTEPHIWTDVVRGANKNIRSNATSSEFTDANNITSFDSDGFSVGTGGAVNENTYTFASWNWKAGTSVSGDTTGSGTLKTYTGSVNTTSGFSIINFVGNGTAGHTIPHHLGVAPKMVIVKNRTSGSTSWQTYHYNLDNGAGTNEIFLDGTGATNGSAGAWNNTAPSSTVITKGTGSYGNENNSNHIMYSFAEKQGYSKFGSYTGNGNVDSPFIYTGFKPAFFMTKEYTNSSGWKIFDNKRANGFNQITETLDASSSDDIRTYNADFLSNGVKLRTSTSFINETGESYIYMAFAENPLVGSNFVPTTAR